jgi:cob(I)alamin adenosyltransferase
VPKDHIVIEVEGALDEAINPFILKYLNRLSDLLFLLACLEEKGEKDRHGKDNGSAPGDRMEHMERMHQSQRP